MKRILLAPTAKAVHLPGKHARNARIPRKMRAITVEPRFNEPLFNKALDITNDILRPGQSYSKMYGKEPRYNEPR